MQGNRSLLSRMKDPGPPGQNLHLHCQDSLHPEKTLLKWMDQTIQSLSSQSPNLLTRIHLQDSQQDLLLNWIQDSTKKYSSSVTPSSRSTARGRSLKRLYMSRSNQTSPEPSDDRTRWDAAFGLFIATVESHDMEAGAASSRGKVFEQVQHSPSPVISVPGGDQSDDEPDTKRPRVDESAYAWVADRQAKHTVLQDTLAKTLKLIKINTIDPKSTKWSLVNEPDCPEFPD